MKKYLLVSLLCGLAIQSFAGSEELSIEERMEKLERIIAEQNAELQELKKLKAEVKSNEDKIALVSQNQEKIKPNNNEEFQFHGYLRTGAEGSIKNGNKNTYSKAKEYVGRWGNEFDNNFNVNLSKKFTLDNGAWTKLAVQFDNWNDTVGKNDDIEMTQLYIEMGNVPMFTGAFKDAVVVAGKKKWDDQQVDIIDYYYQEVQGVGLGLEKIKLWNGSLNLAYISNDFVDGDVSGVKDISKAEEVRAYKVKYTYDDLSLELMYAHATDNERVKGYTRPSGGNGRTESWYRDSADDGFYTGIYYQPNNFFGLKGRGQHYLQYATGLLAGEGIGKINTDHNINAADDAVTYQLGLGGTVQLTDRAYMMVAYKGLRAENVDAKKVVSYSIEDNWDYVGSWRANKLEGDTLVLRPIYSINPNLDLWMEAGIGRKDVESYSGKTEDHLYYKVSAGPQLKYFVGTAETSLRLFVTYIGDQGEVREDGKTTNSTTEDLIAGFQISAWW